MKEESWVRDGIQCRNISNKIHSHIWGIAPADLPVHWPSTPSLSQPGSSPPASPHPLWSWAPLLPSAGCREACAVPEAFLTDLEINQFEFYSCKSFTDTRNLNRERQNNKSRLFKVFPTGVVEAEMPFPPIPKLEAVAEDPFFQAELSIPAEPRGPLALRQEVCLSEHFHSPRVISFSRPLSAHTHAHG